MKKIFIIVLTFVFVLSVATFALSCKKNNDGDTPPDTDIIVPGDPDEPGEQPVLNYTVDFDTDGGTIIESTTAAEGETISVPTEPVKEGFEFIGWQLNGQDYDFTWPITGNITLVAIYNKIVPTYTITFKNDGCEDIVVKVESGELVELPTEPTKEGFTFDAWRTNSGAKFNFKEPITADATLIASWNKVIVNYTVTFLNESGEVTSTMMIEEGKVLEYLPTDPEKENTAEYTYAFKNWVAQTEAGDVVAEANVTVVNTDMVFKPVFDSVKNKYNVIFYDYNNTTIQEMELEYGAEIIAPQDPVRDMTNEYVYSFECWENYTEGAVVTGNATYFAKYSQVIRKYTVTFMVDGNVVEVNANYAYNSTISFPENPTCKTGYEFDVWTYQGETITNDATVTGDMQIDAKLKPVNYTITFVNEFGEIKEKTQNYNVEMEDIDISTNLPTFTDYTFLGWFDGEVKLEVIDTQVAKNITLVAKWRNDNVKILTELAGDSFVYGEKSAQLTFEVVYEGVNQATIEYNWYYKATDAQDFVELELTNNNMTLSNVVESGTYYAVATINVANSDGMHTKVVQESQKVEVAIEKAEQVVEYANGLSFIYNGEPQYLTKDSISVLGGADVKFEGDNFVTYVDQPTTLTIYITETENYKGTTEVVQLTVNPCPVHVELDSEDLVYNGNNQIENVSFRYQGFENVAYDVVVDGEYEIIDAGNYSIKVAISSPNYYADNEVQVNIAQAPCPSDLAISPAAQIGNMGDALSTITLPENYTWVNGAFIIHSSDNYQANYTPVNKNYLPTVVDVFVRAKSVIEYYENGTVIHKDYALVDETLPFYNAGLVNDEELVWFENTLGVGQFYRASSYKQDSYTVKTESVTKFYGVRYYQSTRSDYDGSGTELKKYKNTSHAKIITPIDNQYKFWAHKTSMPYATYSRPTEASFLTDIIITDNFTSMPSVSVNVFIAHAEYAIFNKCTTLKNVIMEGAIEIDEYSFDGKDHGTNAQQPTITSLTLLSSSVTRRGNATYPGCTIYVKNAADVSKYSSWAENGAIVYPVE